MVLKIEPIDSHRHIRTEFCSGQDNLDNYLCKQVSQDIKKRVLSVFVLINEPDSRVLAYYTLSAYTVDITVLHEAFAKRLPRYPYLPAMLLGCLPVDNRQKGQRFGELMLLDELKSVINASTQVASLAVIAEPLDEQVVNFYIKYGFQQFNQSPMKLYIPMQSVEELVQNLGI
jgi:hypothetical protein